MAKNDAAYNYINDLKELPAHSLQEIQRFFEDYKKAEKKQVAVEEFRDKAEAFKIIEESVKLYEEKFVKPL